MLGTLFLKDMLSETILEGDKPLHVMKTEECV